MWGPEGRPSVVLSGGGELANAMEVVVEGKPKKWLRSGEEGGGGHLSKKSMEGDGVTSLLC